MNYHIDIQHASTAAIPVSDAIIAQWVECVLTDHMPAAELTIRLVNEEEIAHQEWFQICVSMGIAGI